MQLVNYTPFSPFVLTPRDPAGDDSIVLILRGTFRFENDRLVPCEEQDAVALKDQFYGDPLETSLFRPSDLCPAKTSGDFFVTGTARAAGGQPCDQWDVTVQMGDLASRVRVTGPREWLYTHSQGWQLSKPSSTTAVALRYENTFGGRDSVSGEIFADNPIGTGFVKIGSRPSNAQPHRIRAPQIESVERPVKSLGASHRPTCFGPIPSFWPERQQLAGTFDENWQLKQWPKLPRDFNNGFYNVAQPELQKKRGFSGDEVIRLSGFGPRCPTELQLPGYSLFSSFLDSAEQRVVCRMRLDTVHVDVDDERAWLVWRSALSHAVDVNSIEAFMKSTRGDVRYVQ